MNEESTKSRSKALTDCKVRILDISGAAADNNNCDGKLLHCTKTLQTR